MSNPFSARRTQRSQLLNVVEYTSTAASVVGVVISALSQQAIYAAAPLSLSLCLNLVNRRRFEQQTEQQFNGAIAQIDQRLLHLDQRVLEQSTQSLTERITDLSEQLTAFGQRQNQTAIELSELRSQLSQLQERFTINQQGQSATATNLGELQARLSQLNAELTAVQQHQAHAATSQTGLEAQISQGLPTIESPPIDLPIELEPDVEPAPIRILPEGEKPVGVLALNLGIDFGTSFTKVCFRDVARDRSEIITFTDDVTHLEEALLPTKIGVLSDGTLIAGLTAAEWKPYENQVQTTVEFIKMRLANCDLPQGAESWQLKKIPGLSEDETIENLCAYYLSRVMTRAKAWIRQNKPELIINQKIEWSANVGVPVEYCDSPPIKRFQKVLSLAWLLSNEPQTEQMTIENLRDRLKPLRATLKETTIDCHAIPEIAAEVWSLLNSREVDEGFYVLFDVGDGTLDGSSFRYWNDEGEKKIDFYFGKVNPLGVTAFSQRLAQELGIAETDVKNTVCGNSTRYSDQFQTSTARKEIQRLVAKVVLEGSQRHREHGFTVMKGKTTLDLLIGGGGGQTSFYTQAITSTHQDFQQNNAGIPEYVVRSLPTPKDLETNGISKHEFYRFAVAYGLSIPEGEQPKRRLPKEMERIKPKTSKQDDSGQPPSYEDMRGSC